MRAFDSLFWRIVLPAPIMLVIGAVALLVVVPWAVRQNIELTARSARHWRSTTSAPATPRSAISSGCRSTG